MAGAVLALFAGLGSWPCTLASAQDNAPPVYVVIRPAPQAFGAIYNGPDGSGGPWPSANFTVGTESSGLTVTSEFTGSGGTLALHGTHSGLGTWRSIATVDVFIRGPVGTAFHLDWTCVQRGNGTSSVGQYGNGASFVGGTCGAFNVAAGPGQSVSDELTTHGALEGVTSAGTTTDPQHPDVSYSYATGFTHWVEVGTNGTCCGPYVGQATIDWTVSVSAYVVRLGQRPPVAVIKAPTAAVVGEVVSLDGSGSYDPDGSISEYRWTVQTPNRRAEYVGQVIAHVFAEPGEHQVSLTVVDMDGQVGRDAQTVAVEIAADADGDSVSDHDDHCPSTPPGEAVDTVGCAWEQVDSDKDGLCNPGASSELWCSGDDNCPAVANADQTDDDGDGIGNVCESISRVKLWMNAFIPRDLPFVYFPATGPAPAPYSGLTMLAGPFTFLGGLNPRFLTDQRLFSMDMRPPPEGPSSRMHSEIEIDLSIPQVIGPLYGTHRADKTVMLVPWFLPFLPPLPGFPESRTLCTAFADTTNMRFTSLARNGAALTTIDLTAGASNPCLPLSPRIDYRGRVTIDTAQRRITFEGFVDRFPAFEMYVSVDGRPARLLFLRPPDLSASPWNLIGAANVPVRGVVEY